ncbi:hypothetical protein [Flavobacterium undicola]|nr:hypothetical protein [Flavobacterium undicola]MBA0884478.1 hypothetical protein [Flavobacterium undicola]
MPGTSKKILFRLFHCPNGEKVIAEIFLSTQPFTDFKASSIAKTEIKI